MRTTVLGLLLVLGFTASAWAWDDDDKPIVLHDGSWVCSTPEAYETAIELESTTDKTFGELKKELIDRKLCIRIGGDDIEDMMAPYVIIVDQLATKVKVKFTIEFYKKFKFLHRRITRVTFTGWTEEARLRDYYDWFNNG